VNYHFVSHQQFNFMSVKEAELIHFPVLRVIIYQACLTGGYYYYYKNRVAMAIGLDNRQGVMQKNCIEALRLLSLQVSSGTLNLCSLTHSLITLSH